MLVTPQANSSVELETSNHLATVNPTPVTNLVGSASYNTTAASSFTGSGSAGQVTQVVAGLDVDFNSGAIYNSSLKVMVAGSQAWDINKWCLCALRWKEALAAGVAPPVILESTHQKALEFVTLDQHRSLE